MPAEERAICDGCGLEFGESELNVDGLCESCREEDADDEGDDLVDA